MEFIAQSPDTLFFGGMFAMFFGLTIISMVVHKIFS
jgi:hypothetical protein